MAIRAGSLEEYYKLASNRLEELNEIAGTTFEVEADVSEREHLTEVLKSLREDVLMGDVFTANNGDFNGFNVADEEIEARMTEAFDRLVEDGDIIAPEVSEEVAKTTDGSDEDKEVEVVEDDDGPNEEKEPEVAENADEPDEDREPEVAENTGESMESESNFDRYINDFLANPDYEVSDHLRELIGQKEDGDIYKQPTIEQHLEPIEELEEKIRRIDLPKNDRNAYMRHASDEDRENESERLKEELKEKQEKLGKRWLIKLKIEKCNRELKAKEDELKNLKSQLDKLPKDSPERKVLEAKILALSGEIDSLNMEVSGMAEEYDNCLNEITNEIEETIEKGEDKKNKENSSEKNEKAEEKAKDTVTRDNSTSINGSGGTPAYGGTPMYGSSAPAYSGTPMYRSGGGTSGTGNLPEKKKKLKDRVIDFVKKQLEKIAKIKANREAKKEEKETKKAEKMATKEAKRAEREAKKKDKKQQVRESQEKLPDEILYSEDLKRLYFVQYIRLAKELKPVVDGKYLYYLRVNEKNSKMEYVKMPLQNFDISKKGLTKAISGMKDRMCDDYLIPRDELEKDSTNYELLKKSPEELVKILTKSASRKEKERRILATLCAIQASNFRSEANKQFKAIKDGNLRFDEGAFKPNMNVDKKGNVTFQDNDEPNPILESVKKAIERRQNRDVTRSETVEPELAQILQEHTQIPQPQVPQEKEMIRPLTQEQISIYENTRNTVQDRLSQAQDKIPFNIDIKNDQDKITSEVTEFIYTREDGRGAMMIDKDHYFTTRAQRRLLRELDIETGEFNGREFISYEDFVNKCSERLDIEVTNDNQSEKETVTSKENEQNKHDEQNRDDSGKVVDVHVPERRRRREEVDAHVPEREGSGGEVKKKNKIPERVVFRDDSATLIPERVVPRDDSATLIPERVVPRDNSATIIPKRVIPRDDNATLIRSTDQKVDPKTAAIRDAIFGKSDVSKTHEGEGRSTSQEPPVPNFDRNQRRQNKHREGGAKREQNNQEYER